MYKLFLTGTLALVIFSARTAGGQEIPLGLSEAVHIAVTAEDPSLLRIEARAEALEQRAIADAQLPDPTIRGAVANLPTNTFRFEQENMTQLQLGLRQALPVGRTLSLKGERRKDEAEAERARKALALREIELAVRTGWFSLFYLKNAQDYISQSRNNVNQLIEALTATFATGGLTTQDILRAELELSLLDDRLLELKRRTELARAGLARFLGSAASRPLPEALPILPAPPAVTVLAQALPDHPAVLVDNAQIAVASKDVELVEQTYKPAWALEGGYGLRGGGRANFASFGVTLSIPLFTAKRQDRQLSAAMKERSAAQLGRAEKLLNLRRDLEQAYANWRYAGSRIELYATAVNQRTDEAAEASISSYASGLTDFPELVRSQLAELDTRLKHLELRTEQAKAWAVINYLAGDIQ